MEAKSSYNAAVIALPPDVRRVIDRLEQSGFEGFAVGGCVRDSLLGKEPKDWDIAVSAKPEQVKKIFSRTVDTGIAHGTVTVLIGGRGYELTTYRVDGEYTDGRHPDSVSFTPSLEEDLRRRDFTINAMAYNDSCGLIDLFGGREDLAEGRIRCVGDPRERFKEDALRIMRAVRFSAQLGFEIETETCRAASDMAQTLERISAERVRDELCKLLESNHPERVMLLWALHITSVVLPEFDAAMKTPTGLPAFDAFLPFLKTEELFGGRKTGEDTVGDFAVRMLCAVKPDRSLRLCALLMKLGKAVCARQDSSGGWVFPGYAVKGSEIAEKILRRLRSDHVTIQRVCRLTAMQEMEPGLSPEEVRRQVCDAGTDLYPLYLEMKEAEYLALPAGKGRALLEKLEITRTLYEDVLARGDCISLRGLAVNGSDLISEGMRPGSAMGKLLSELLDEVLTDPALNQKEHLLRKARKWIECNKP